MGLSLSNLTKDAVKKVINNNSAIKNYINSNAAVKSAVDKALGNSTTSSSTSSKSTSGNSTKLNADPEGTVIKDNAGNDVGISYSQTPTWLSGDLKTSRNQSTVRSSANNTADNLTYAGGNTNYGIGTENDYINRIADLQKVAKNAEYANAYNKVLAQLDESRAKTRAEYRNQMNGADVANQMNLKNYFENVANRGQTYSGSTSQGELALRIAGINNQSTLANSRAQALANLDRDEAQAYNDYVTNVATSDASIEATRYKNLLDQYRLDREAQTKAEKEAFQREIATINQYYQDYTAEIQRREALDPNDPLIPYLKIARQEKIDEIEKGYLEAEKEAEAQRQAQAKLMLSMNDFAGLRELGYDTTNLEREFNLDLANTQSQIAKRYKNNNNNNNNTTKSQYSNVLKGVQGYLKSNGESYGENIKGANYLVGEVMNGDISVDEMTNIMRQTSMPIAVVARSLKQQYHEDDASIAGFVQDYVGNISDDYINKIIDYANKK